MSYFPKEFISKIQLHLVRNTWDSTKATAPLILGIFGPPGEGKSYQSEKILEELGYGIINLSTSDFGSALEAEAAKFICAKYVEATALTRIHGKPHVLLCDDIDVAIGNWGDLTQYTVNRQYIIGELMHICDSPELVRVDRDKLSKEASDALNIDLLRDRYITLPTLRTPIILTGNDSAKLYDPLRRAGRMTNFEWKPRTKEKASVIANILSISNTNAIYLLKETNKFAKECGIDYSLPVSFFSTLKSRIQDDYIIKNISEHGWTSSLKFFSTANNYNKPINVEQYLSLSKSCIPELKIKSHLQPTSNVYQKCIKALKGVRKP